MERVVVGPGGMLLQVSKCLRPAAACTAVRRWQQAPRSDSGRGAGGRSKQAAVCGLLARPPSPLLPCSTTVTLLTVSPARLHMAASPSLRRVQFLCWGNSCAFALVVEFVTCALSALPCPWLWSAKHDGAHLLCQPELPPPPAEGLGVAGGHGAGRHLLRGHTQGQGAHDDFEVRPLVLGVGWVLECAGPADPCTRVGTGMRRARRSLHWPCLLRRMHPQRPHSFPSPLLTAPQPHTLPHNIAGTARLQPPWTRAWTASSVRTGAQSGSRRVHAGVCATAASRHGGCLRLWARATGRKRTQRHRVEVGLGAHTLPRPLIAAATTRRCRRCRTRAG